MIQWSRDGQSIEIATSDHAITVGSATFKTARSDKLAKVARSISRALVDAVQDGRGKHAIVSEGDDAIILAFCLVTRLRALGASPSWRHTNVAETGDPYIVRLRQAAESIAIAQPKSRREKPRVVQCPGNNAGQPNQLARALRRAGYQALSLSVGSGGRFAYPSDVIFPEGLVDSSAAVTNWLLANADLVHYHARPLYWHFQNGRLYPPALADLAALKAAGKSIVFSFRGGELRQHDVFARVCPFAWAQDDDYADFLSDDEKRQFATLVTAMADVVTVTDPELQTYLPEARILPRCIDCEEWPYIGSGHNERPLIVHAPSRKNVKGTQHVLDAVERLRDRYDFDFRLVEGLTNQEARKVYEQADIIVDQLRIGWYGVLAVEGMALGKPVVSYIREDLANDTPIINANPGTIHDRLAELLDHPERLPALGRASRDYCERIHDVGPVARLLQSYYEDARAVPVDPLTKFYAASAADLNRSLAGHAAASSDVILRKIGEIKTLRMEAVSELKQTRKLLQRSLSAHETTIARLDELKRQRDVYARQIRRLLAS